MNKIEFSQNNSKKRNFANDFDKKLCEKVLSLEFFVKKIVLNHKSIIFKKMTKNYEMANRKDFAIKGLFWLIKKKISIRLKNECFERLCKRKMGLNIKKKGETEIRPNFLMKFTKNFEKIPLNLFSIENIRKGVMLKEKLNFLEKIFKDKKLEIFYCFFTRIVMFNITIKKIEERVLKLEKTIGKVFNNFRRNEVGDFFLSLKKYCKTKKLFQKFIFIFFKNLTFIFRTRTLYAFNLIKENCNIKNCEVKLNLIYFYFLN